MKQLKGSLMLLLAAFFWGTTFVAQTSATDNIGPFTFNATRSFVGALFLFGVILISSKMKKAKAVNQDSLSIKGNDSEQNKVEGAQNSGDTRIAYKEQKKQKSVIVCGITCGLVLFIAMNLQQGGIALYPDGVASSSRSGFLTATYVVMVAICDRLKGNKLHKIIYAAVLVCIVGMYLLCMAGGIDAVYIGDVFGLLCAVFFTMHIIVVDHFSYCESVKLSCLQFVTTGVLSTIAMFIFEQPNPDMILNATVPILYAGILSSGIAYTLQMEGQKYAQPSVASIIMSLESVFAMIGGWLVLNERLSAREFTGCLLVFTAVIMAQVPSMLKTEKSAESVES